MAILDFANLLYIWYPFFFSFLFMISLNIVIAIFTLRGDNNKLFFAPATTFKSEREREVTIAVALVRRAMNKW